MDKHQNSKIPEKLKNWKTKNSKDSNYYKLVRVYLEGVLGSSGLIDSNQPRTNTPVLLEINEINTNFNNNINDNINEKLEKLTLVNN